MIISYFPTGGSGSSSATGGNLEKTSWADISAIAKSGKAADYFSVGDTKTITLGAYTYRARILGFYHDPVAVSTYGNSNAGITFETVEMYPSTTVYYSGSPSAKNVVYWAGDPNGLSSTTLYESTMRSTTLPSLLTKLPTDLQNVIVPVYKKYHITRLDSGDDKYIETVEDKLFLLSAIEYGIATTAANASEGSVYAFYDGAKQADIAKWLASSETTDLLKTRWTRTAYVVSSSGNYSYVITASGGIGNGPMGGTTRYFSIAFCV